MKLKRYGFPIVPDFGGTAHAYCGSTLPAAIGDCLSWTSKPQRDAMLRAYIIMSRVKEAENMLIVQPYSPHLFRQGMLPGPRLLLDVLTKKLTTTSQVKAAWKEEDRKAAKEKEERVDWLSSMRLACRICTDKQTAMEKEKKEERGEDVDVWKEMKHSVPVGTRPFSSKTSCDEAQIWSA